MAEIYTARISDEPIAIGEESGMLEIYDGLKTPVSQDTFILSSAHAAEIERYAQLSARAYGNEAGIAEPTRVQQEFGVPALVVRVDCSIDDKGDVVMYEMEDSPSGQGLTHVLHEHVMGRGIRQTIIDHYEEHLGGLPHILVSPQRNHGTDDSIIVGSDHYSYPGPTKLPKTPVIVKAIPGSPESHTQYLHLQEDAVAPLVTEGDKSYAQRTGDLKIVKNEDDLLQNDCEELRSQVLKRRLGSMAQGISIYLSPEDRKKFGNQGIVTATRLRNNLGQYLENGGALTQEFSPPLQLENNAKKRHAIMRIFVLLGRDATAQAIGGCYVARPTLLVHGAKDSVTGAVLVE